MKRFCLFTRSTAEATAEETDSAGLQLAGLDHPQTTQHQLLMQRYSSLLDKHPDTNSQTLRPSKSPYRFSVIRASKPLSRMAGMWLRSSCSSTMLMRGFLVGVSKYCCHRSYSTASLFCISHNSMVEAGWAVQVLLPLLVLSFQSFLHQPESHA